MLLARKLTSEPSLTESLACWSVRLAAREGVHQPFTFADDLLREDRPGEGRVRELCRAEVAALRHAADTGDRERADTVAAMWMAVDHQHDAREVRTAAAAAVAGCRTRQAGGRAA